MDYSQNGNYLALAGVVVLVLSKFGVTTTVDNIFVIAGAVVSVIGIVKQMIAHRKLGIAVGAVRP